uniref:Glycosyltransferase family 1 protein n=1 Tax=Desulfobacca acetoxidans TaxID=60893 RepID=A0A7C5ALM6_9BACT
MVTAHFPKRRSSTVKVAHVVTTFYDTNATGWVMALAEEQRKKGWQVDLVVGRNASADLLAEKKGAGFGVCQIGSLRKYIHPFHDLMALVELYRLFQKRRYEVVHTHLAKAGVLGRLAAGMAGIPRVIHSVYGATFAKTQFFGRRLLFRGLERLAGRATDVFIFVGEELKEAYCREGVCPPPKARVVYYGKDLRPFMEVGGLTREERLARRLDLGFSPHDLILGNVSRLVPWKGHYDALLVLSELKRHHPRAKLVIVGDAKTPSERGYRNRLQRYVRKQGLQEDVRFTGWVKDPAHYFAIFDLYLLTSRPLEGVPGAVIEAAVAGVPVVGYECFGVREIPGVRATLVPSGDLKALITAVRKELKRVGAAKDRTPPDLADLAKLCRKFDLTRMIRGTTEIYQELLRDLNGPCSSWELLPVLGKRS